jgi:hypothetical protein
VAEPLYVVLGALIATGGAAILVTSLVPALRRFRIWQLRGAWTPPLAGTLYGVWLALCGIAFIFASGSVPRTVLMPLGILAGLLAIVIDRRAKKSNGAA